MIISIINMVYFLWYLSVYQFYCNVYPFNKTHLTFVVPVSILPGYMTLNKCL